MFCWACLLALLVSVDGNGKSDDKIQNAMTALSNKLKSVEERVSLMKRSTQSDGHGEKEKGGSDDGLFDTFFNTGSGSDGESGKDLKSEEALGDQENASGKALSSTGFRSWKAGGLERGEIPSEDLAEKSDQAGFRNGYGYGRYGYRNGYDDRHLKGYGYGPIIMPGDKKRIGGKGEGDLKTKEASGKSGSSGKDEKDRESRKYRNSLKYEGKNNHKKYSDEVTKKY